MACVTSDEYLGLYQSPIGLTQRGGVSDLRPQEANCSFASECGSTNSQNAGIVKIVKVRFVKSIDLTPLVRGE